MKKTKYRFTYDEWRLIIQALNDLRNKLIAEDEYTDAVDDTLLTVMRAKIRKVKTA